MKNYNLKSFPNNLRILLQNDYRIKLFSKLWQTLESSTNISKVINGYSSSSIRKFKLGKNSRGTEAYIPISFIKKISKILNLNSTSVSH